MGDLVELTAVEQRRLIGTKQVSARELLDAHLARVDAVNPATNAIVALDPEVGRRRAAAVDDAIAKGEDPGPLAGLVTAHKDLEETADFPTSFGSPLFGADHRPAADGLLVARMKAAGAVAIGKTNTPEFGAGSHTFNEVYGVTRNPWGLERSAGGSSGGAAVALACRMVATADGSDTGGSLRNPAAWNNVVGFRPTVRVVPVRRPGQRLDADQRARPDGSHHRRRRPPARRAGRARRPRPDASADRPATRAAPARAAAARGLVARPRCAGRAHAARRPRRHPSGDG